jgi:hypothetical protein
MKNIFKTFLAILITSVVLMYAGFNNFYPLLYSDTGTYIRSGFTGTIPIDRPIFYGIFLRHTSLATSLWYVIFMQGVLLSSLIFFVTREFFKNNLLFFYYFFIIFLLFFYY